METPCFYKECNNEGNSSHIFVSMDRITEFYPAHRHDFVEMYYVIEGEGTDIINGIEHKLEPGSFVLLLPWHIHEIHSCNTSPVRIYKCDFGMELLLSDDPLYSEIQGLYFDFTNIPAVIHVEGLLDNQIFELFERLKNEYIGRKTYSRTLVKMKIIELLIEFSRGYKENKGTKTAKASSGDVEDKIWDIITYIHMHITEDILVSHIAGIFDTEELLVNKWLEQQTGLKFPELVTEIRIRHACVMLSHPEIPISFIARAIGFKSSVTFYRKFKELKGMNPEEYRKNDRRESSQGNALKVINPNIVWKIIYFMHLHFQEDITLASIAENFHYSEVYLRELIKEYAGQSFTELLHEIRIMHACSILTSTKMPVAEVAYKVGFDSRETFFRAFQKLRGTTPGKYRKLK